MRTTQLLPFALVGTAMAIAIPVQIQERANGILHKRDYVTKSEVVWTTTTVWSTEFVYETGTPDVGAAGFEGNEEPQPASTTHTQHKTHTKTTTVQFTAPASSAAAPVPTSTSSSAAPPPPPSTSSTPTEAPAPTSTFVPPPAPTTSTSVSVAPVETSAPAPAPAPTTSSEPAPAPAASSAAPAAASSSSSSSSSGATGEGTEAAPFVGQGTFYSTGMGSCGVTSTDSQAIVAVGAGYMSKFNGANPNNNPKCGKSITIEYNGVQKTATIEDTCPGCATEFDLDMSPSLFQEFADEGVGRLFGVKWWFN